MIKIWAPVFFCTQKRLSNSKTASIIPIYIKYIIYYIYKIISILGLLAQEICALSLVITFHSFNCDYLICTKNQLTQKQMKNYTILKLCYNRHWSTDISDHFPFSSYLTKLQKIRILLKNWSLSLFSKYGPVTPFKKPGKTIGGKAYRSLLIKTLHKQTDSDTARQRETKK